MKTLLIALALAVPLAACRSPVYSGTRGAEPATPSFDVRSSMRASRSGWYLVAVSVRSNSDATLDVDPTMFALHAEEPALFVQWSNVSGGAGFRMPKSIAPHGSAQGQILFRLEGARRPPEHVELVVSLPDGVHTCDFSRARRGYESVEKS